MVINNPESSEDLSEFDKESNGINITKLNVSVLEKTSLTRTFINFVKSFIGTGILGLPYAFLEGGVIFSIFGMIVLGIISNYSIRLLVYVSDEIEKQTGKQLSYGEICKFLFGTKGQTILDVSLSLTQIGFCCVYVIFIADNTSAIIKDIIPSWVIVILLIPFLTLACCIREFRNLAYLSFIGQILSFIAYGIIMIFSFLSLLENHPSIVAINWSGLPIFFGMAVFSYAGIGGVLPMKRSMIYPYQYIFVLDIGFLVIMVLLIVFGTIGYCGYGGAVNPNGITLNLPQNSVWTIFTQVSLIIGIYATYPIVMYPVFEILDEILFTSSHFKNMGSLSNTKKYWISNIMRLLLVVITSIIAISIPYFSLFVSLVGALGSSFIAFIMPCILHLKAFHNRVSKIQIYTNWILVIFGIIASIVSATITIIQLVEAIFGLDFGI